MAIQLSVRRRFCDVGILAKLHLKMSRNLLKGRSALDEDVRSSVQVNLVHGFWKKDDPSRLNLQVSLLLATQAKHSLTRSKGSSQQISECETDRRVSTGNVRHPSFQDDGKPTSRRYCPGHHPYFEHD